jgi:hemerythrin superfamily protein
MNIISLTELTDTSKYCMISYDTKTKVFIFVKEGFSSLYKKVVNKEISMYDIITNDEYDDKIVLQKTFSSFCNECKDNETYFNDCKKCKNNDLLAKYCDYSQIICNNCYKFLVNYNEEEEQGVFEAYLIINKENEKDICLGYMCETCNNNLYKTPDNFVCIHEKSTIELCKNSCKIYDEEQYLDDLADDYISRMKEYDY